MIWIFLNLFSLHLFLSLGTLQDGGLPHFLRMFFAPEIWALIGVIMLFFRFVMFRKYYEKE